MAFFGSDWLDDYDDTPIGAPIHNDFEYCDYNLHNHWKEDNFNDKPMGGLHENEIEDIDYEEIN